MNSVNIRMSKNEFDSNVMNPDGITMTMGRWLIENVGDGMMGIKGKNGVWNRKLSHDDNDIILSYNFKNHKDAVMFALRWS